MKISKIFAAMSAAAIAASMVALPAAADDAAAGSTMKAYNVGFNIQFGHFYGGTITATATGGNVLGMAKAEDGSLTCTGEKVDSQKMWVVNDWSSTVSNDFVEGIAIADGTYDANNPGWNGMWIQCYIDDLSAGLEVTFEISAEDGTWKEMDPSEDEFSGWSVLVPAVDGHDAFVHTEANGNQPSQKTFTYTLTISGDELQAAMDAKGTKPQVAEEEISTGDTSTTDSTGSTASGSSSTTSSGSSSTGSTGGSSNTSSKGGSTTTSKGGSTTSTKTTTSTTSASSDNTANAESGAAAGVGLAIAALAGAAIVVSRKK